MSKLNRLLASPCAIKDRDNQKLRPFQCNQVSFRAKLALPPTVVDPKMVAVKVLATEKETIAHLF